MKSMDELIEIVRRLRSPDGCPWDREQTHKSVRGHFVEECAELLEAIDDEDDDAMREEIGDVLMHLVLHAQIASEDGKFSFDDAAKELCQKLVRRHPHVFGSESANSSEEVLDIWKAVKIAENKPRAKGGLFDGIPKTLSALRLARDIAKKADEKVLLSARKTSLEKCECGESASLKFGEKIFNSISECVENGIEPEGALRDFIAEIKNADALANPKRS